MSIAKLLVYLIIVFGLLRQSPDHCANGLPSEIVDTKHLRLVCLAQDEGFLALALVETLPV